MKRLLFCIFTMLVVSASAYVMAQTQATETNATFLPDYQQQEPIAQTDNPKLFFATLFKFAFSLVVVIVLVYAVLYMLKMFTGKFKPRGAAELGMCQLLDTLAIDAQKKIYLIGIDTKRVLVVGVNDKEMSLLSSIDNPQDAAELVAKVKDKWQKTNSFDQHLKVAQKKNKAQAILRNQINGLNDFIQGLQKKNQD